ncbi:transglycosylase SLT domain-containing protein [Fodinibius saliphilus]|uniref:transglycosylase SLT domain-containing protein n=1 Tax=Fodinibius saliphilus TaxID=1920650 RepID=UPI00110845A9|nr:transporter substrate-binding domain-containing protein [Fodinibius saliphilus]
MRKLINVPSRLYLAGTLAVSLLLSSCSFSEDVPLGDDTDQQGLNVSVVEPIKRDYGQIKENGVLRMITRYSSNTYFLHQGLEWGFEYELVDKFADQHDLALEVVVIGPDENPYDLLNSGKGDIIAANYTRTPERKKYVDFTRPYNLVNQLLVFSDKVGEPPSSVEEVVEQGIPITVRRNSSYYYRLQELKSKGLDLSINVVSNKKDTESLLYEISNGKYLATVADDNIFQASNKYMQGIQQGPVMAKNDTIAWAIRENAPSLKTELNRFLYDHFRFGGPNESPKRSTFLNILRKRYFKEGPQIADYYNPESSMLGGGVISPYDDLIKNVADSAGVDWLLVASIIAQETKFNPNAKSWAGAVGLMQVLPRYSQTPSEELLYDEEINLREGVRIINEHLNHYSYMDSTDKWSFALAAYNAGQGHVADARRLAIDQNKDPNEWKNVSDALLKLMQRKYYKDARYGFCRGIETVRYVEEIKNRYNIYQTILTLSNEEENNRGPGVLGIFN